MTDKRRVTIWLPKADIEFLDEAYPGKRSDVIRRLVSAFVRQKREEMARNVREQLDD